MSDLEKLKYLLTLVNQALREKYDFQYGLALILGSHNGVTTYGLAELNSSTVSGRWIVSPRMSPETPIRRLETCLKDADYMHKLATLMAIPDNV